MPLFLLDTKVLSLFARGVDQAIAEQITLRLDTCVLSAVSWYELVYGAARNPHPVRSAERLTLLRDVFPFVRPFGEDDAAEAAYLERLNPNAQPIGPHDLLLVGKALAMGAVLVTHNVREFARVPPARCGRLAGSEVSCSHFS